MVYHWYIAVLIVSYLLGSLSFGTVISRANGVNIFDGGSGSSGATNVQRMVGKRAGRTVFILDFLKGFAPTLLLLKFYPMGNIPSERLAMTCLLGILVGHSLSIFHHFRGGKGIASMMGGLLSIMPSSFAIGILVWLVIFHATRIVSVASLCFSTSVMLTAYLFYAPEYIIFALLLNLIVFWRHRENIARLINGTEHRFM
ncbi:MAG: glycerol-3-phosphate 1-O-acyltransferase PlsY [Puniceicoccales bacterium]|nr:glycerol-3-phosphate 1-O-acyltransferase PlsY [Puniceicoccales bacterium]